MMLKAGVEKTAVKAKMNQDVIFNKIYFIYFWHVTQGLSIEEQQHVLGECDTITTLPDAKPIPVKNNLISLHWDPIGNLSQKELQGSFWGELRGKNKSCSLGGEEMDRLASMFAKKDTNAPKKEEATKPTGEKASAPKLKFIEMSR